MGMYSPFHVLFVVMRGTHADFSITFLFDCVVYGVQTMAINKGDVYEVRRIKRKRKSDSNEWEYLCKWVGYSDESWESASTLRIGAKEMLNKFNENRSSHNRGMPLNKRAKRK